MKAPGTANNTTFLPRHSSVLSFTAIKRCAKSRAKLIVGLKALTNAACELRKCRISPQHCVFFKARSMHTLLSSSFECGTYWNDPSGMVSPTLIYRPKSISNTTVNKKLTWPTIMSFERRVGGGGGSEKPKRKPSEDLGRVPI